jgi:hypothetical protein
LRCLVLEQAALAFCDHVVSPIASRSHLERRGPKTEFDPVINCRAGRYLLFEIGHSVPGLARLIRLFAPYHFYLRVQRETFASERAEI